MTKAFVRPRPIRVAFALVSRPERYAFDSTAFPTLKDAGLKAFDGYLKQIDGMLTEREWFLDPARRGLEFTTL